jgi:hypothetical protein
MIARGGPTCMLTALWGVVMGIVAMTIALAHGATICKAPSISQDMPYPSARKIIIKSGFMAPNIPAYGYDPKDQKVISECYGQVVICNKYPEIDSCSGSGHCLMIFSDAYGNILRVTTYGDIGMEKRPPYVTGFEISCKQ